MSQPSPDAAPTAAHPLRPDPFSDARGRFAFLAETSRCLADSLDFETTLATGAGLALPHFGTWCMVDVVEADDAIRRVAVIHPDAAKQRLARDFYAAHPPGRGDPLGAPRVIRTRESEFVLAYDDVLEGIAEEEHRLILQELGARSFLTVPMAARGRTLGAITFVSDDRRRHDAADLLLAEDLGRRCGMALDNARLYAASLEADRAKSTFLGTISHEFRTPLTAVQGFTDLLTEEVGGPLNEAQKHQVERIRAAGDHLLGLIEEILGFAQQQAGRSELRLRDVDLAGVVRDAAALVQPLADAKGLRLLLAVPAEPVPFRTDPGRFRQVVLNLAANAVKFTTEGEVRIDLEAADGCVSLRVGDTGMGIAPEHAEHVFDAFWQVDRSSSRQGGTGLGLAVTRQLADRLGGEVALASGPEGGSTFTVRLPCLPAEPAAADAEEAAQLSLREQRVRGRRGEPRRRAAPDTPRAGEIPPLPA